MNYIVLIGLLIYLIHHSHSYLRQFKQNDFDKWIDDKNFLVVLFCKTLQDKSCHRELIGLNKIADSFHSNKDIVVGYIDKEADHILFSRYNIQSYPFLKFFPYGMGTVDYRPAIKYEETRTKILEVREEYQNKVQDISQVRRNEKKSKKSNIQQIDWLDVDSTLHNENHHSLLVLYDEGCGEPCENVEQVADAFANEESMKFYRMNVDDRGKLVDIYQLTNNPSIYWFPKSNKQTGFIYGGKITVPILLEFVNDNAGLARNIDGHLKLTAGRILDIDQIIKENIINILLKRNLEYVEYLIEQKRKDLPHAEEFINYYLAIIKELSKDKASADKILDREQVFIGKRISQKSLTSAERDYWHKYYNIITGIIEFATHALSDNSFEIEALNADPYVVPSEMGKKPFVSKHSSRHDEL